MAKYGLFALKYGCARSSLKMFKVHRGQERAGNLSSALNLFFPFGVSESDFAWLSKAFCVP